MTNYENLTNENLTLNYYCAMNSNDLTSYGLNCYANLSCAKNFLSYWNLNDSTNCDCYSTSKNWNCYGCSSYEKMSCVNLTNDSMNCESCFENYLKMKVLYLCHTD